MIQIEKSQKRTLRFVGFNLPPEFAAKVRAETWRRDRSLRILLKDQWASFKKSPKCEKP